MLAEGLKHPDFAKYEVHAQMLTRWIAKYLRLEKAVLHDEVLTVAQEVVRLAKITYKIEPAIQILPKPKRVRRRKPDLMAVPGDEPESAKRTILSKRTRQTEAPKQLAMF